MDAVKPYWASGIGRYACCRLVMSQVAEQNGPVATQEDEVQELMKSLNPNDGYRMSQKGYKKTRWLKSVNGIIWMELFKHKDFFCPIKDV